MEVVQDLSFKGIMKKGIGVPIVLLMILSMMILPLPPIILDLLFTFNITLSLVVILAGIYCLRPLEFAAFPTIILVATLMRLALNVASTRVVLLNGHMGTAAAGKVIESFGKVVIGGNYAVGLVVFLILIIINFIVVTKGAGRISEVSARFTLDAMPGKQMAIDADLNAGVISQEEAKQSREEVTIEADFYGSMDGASKFVRGDAVAGILILFINVIGGTLIGTLQHNLSIGDAMEVYALLTIGDGLVAQIPSLILSTAAAMMVTRVSRSEDMSKQVVNQILASSKPLYITSSILIGLGLIPGMPHMSFLGLGSLMAIGTYAYANRDTLFATATQDLATPVESEQQEAVAAAESHDLNWEDVPPVDVIGLEIGYRIIPMVDKEQGGELMARIKGVRKKLSQELGFLVPTVHIRDNLDLDPNTYRITILGVTIGEDKIFPEQNLAINPGQVYGSIKGTKVNDPSFGLEAYWIDAKEKENAQTSGYTVVDASTVLATHLSQVLYGHAYQLFGHEQAQKLLDILSKESPKLVDDLVPNTLSMAVIVKVLQNLLYENVPIKDIRTIAEILTESGQKSQEPAILTTAVRVGLGPMIVQQINGFSKELPVITLHSSLEQLLQKSVQAAEENSFVIEPNLADRMSKSLKKCAESQELLGSPVVLLVSVALRPMLSKFVRNVSNSMSVLSYQEIPENLQIRIVATVGEE